MAKIVQKSAGNSGSEDRFIELFCDAFGAENGQFVYLQYPFVDIYGRHRTIDFAVNHPDGRFAFEIGWNKWHQPRVISTEKYHDNLLKQNSMVYEGWHVYHWTSEQLERASQRVKDELVTFLGQSPIFRMIDDALPPQFGEALELMDHQEEVIENLAKMRGQHNSIALVFHAMVPARPSPLYQMPSASASTHFFWHIYMSSWGRPSIHSSEYGRTFPLVDSREAVMTRIHSTCAERSRVSRRGTLALIHSENYFDHPIRMENGVPETTKSDARYHGFGIRSMQLLAESYGGTLSIQIDGDIFSIKLILPLTEVT